MIRKIVELTILMLVATWAVTGTRAQYVNGSIAPVTAGQFCNEIRGWIGMSRAGHTLRSVSCSGGGHEFTIHVRID